MIYWIIWETMFWLCK